MASANNPQVKTHVPEPQSKFQSHNYMYKSALVTLFLVLLPLFPFQAPEFINQVVNARSWELFQLIFVGIAVSYGLFSKRNDEEEKDHSAQSSYVSKLLQVSSVFDDDDDESDQHPDESKVQTWNSQYHREDPVHVVSKQVQQTPLVKKDNNNGFTSEKPLLLPVRSLKQRVSDPNETDLIEDSGGKAGLVNRSSSKRFERNLSDGSKIKVDENVVLRSPIPWRSKSGSRIEMEGNGEVPGLSRSENRSLKLNSKSLSFESQVKSSHDQDVVRTKKKKSSSPPPPPPPPPPPRFLRKSNSSVMENRASPEKVFRRSARSMPEEELSESEVEELPTRMNFDLDLKVGDQNNGSQLKRSVRTFRLSEPFVEAEKKSTDYEIKFTERQAYINGMTTINEKIPLAETRAYVDFSKEEKKESENSETSDEDSEADHTEDDNFERSPVNEETATDDVANDGGPDVDKKADEFIAKFREQIRLQRIESIRRSTTQRADKSLR